ncbi:MAG: copper chaperone PCu(A)C [Rhodospirillaceae bacterium]|nr:copper chaperone PCu(A)C [Rhodospirillaceae bacterium]
MRRLLLYVVIFLFAFDAPAKAADLAVEQPWARATPGRAPTGAAYLTLVNRGKDDDRLLGAASPVAAKAELHGHQAATGHAGHVMEMRPVAEVQVKAGQTVVFKPDSLHVMLVGLKAPLKEGERFQLILRFAKAGEIQVEVPVGRAGAMAAPK